jgi:hypothetical protein
MVEQEAAQVGGWFVWGVGAGWGGAVMGVCFGGRRLSQTCSWGFEAQPSRVSGGHKTSTLSTPPPEIPQPPNPSTSPQPPTPKPPQEGEGAGAEGGAAPAVEERLKEMENLPGRGGSEVSFFRFLGLNWFSLPSLLGDREPPG